MEKEGEGAESGDGKEKAHAKPNTWQREQHEAHLRTINALTNQLAANQESEKASDEKKAFREKITIGLLVVTVVLTALTYGVFDKQLTEMRKASEGADKALEASHFAAMNALMGAHIDSDNALLGATANSNAAIKQAQNAADTAIQKATEANKISRDAQRAQLSMLDASASVVPQGNGRFVLNVVWQVNNTGPTPGFIEAVPLGVIFGGLPDQRPPLPKGSGIGYYVAQNRQSFYNTWSVQVPEVEYIQYRVDVPMFIYGEIQYVDVFGKKHKSGFAFQTFRNGNQSMLIARRAYWNYD
jgi:hypothetical protein